MRDLAVILIVLGSLPVIAVRPYVGILMWSWIAYMNPQRLTWGFAFNFPFGMLIGLTTIFAWLVSREPKRIPWTGLTVILVVFVLWINVTTLFALVPEAAYAKWEEVMKILLMTFVTMALMRTRGRIDALVWVIALSIGFYSIKGGLFTVLTGGLWQVRGPLHSFISDNNALALATIMILPLMRYLHLQATARWVRWGLVGAMGLSLFSVLASYSRGAFLALAVMAFFLAMKSRRRFVFGSVFTMALIAAVVFMPGKWAERIESIQDYQSDASAQTRLNAWRFAFNLAKAHPVFGGGFGTFDQELFQQYAPRPELVVNAHSIYFQVLGEHGFVGLALFLMLGSGALLSGGWVIRRTRDRPDLRWARDLAAMLQVSLIGYAVGGTFLNLAFFDLYYHLIALMILTRSLVSKALAKAPAAQPAVREGHVLQVEALAPGSRPGS